MIAKVKKEYKADQFVDYFPWWTDLFLTTPNSLDVYICGWWTCGALLNLIGRLEKIKK